MAKKSTKSEEPKKKKPISLNILEIAKRLQKLEETGGGGGTPYTLPTASADTKGGVKIGEGLTMNGEVLSATGGPADSAKRSDIATEFSTETSYTAGCFVYYEGKLYQFNADHAAGTWDPTDVVVANVTDQVVSNKAAIDGLTASDISYDNTTSGLTATNEQAAIDELADRVTAQAIDGDYVDISSYIYDGATYNDYTVPRDGYVVFKYSAASDGGMLVKTDDNNHITMATTKELIQSIYFKKGLQVCFGSTPTLGRFYPLV